MDKAILTKPQAEAIDSILTATHWTAETFVRNHAENSRQWVAPYDVLNGVPLDSIIRALYIGYEVEQTVEEKLLAAYKAALPYQAPPDVQTAFREGMKKACEITGIKVKWARD
ncbi:hypothetical protein UY286_08725 [Paenibacillus polymyxa]|uniref:hypothetical protein n=1 Tax=Paenibacillus polymyxa TaxID=1406 RepID=UPI002AB3CBF1|nr:hypothetical protein [Paenibacillus polymyxa]MDY7990667.1 hypothetical protein [Paenibacillus polymyxa]MDY8117522.1 hypothetical protein [Paenibacillus polymyxa]